MMMIMMMMMIYDDGGDDDDDDDDDDVIVMMMTMMMMMMMMMMIMMMMTMMIMIMVTSVMVMMVMLMIMMKMMMMVMMMMIMMMMKSWGYFKVSCASSGLWIVFDLARLKMKCLQFAFENRDRVRLSDVDGKSIPSRRSSETKLSSSFWWKYSAQSDHSGCLKEELISARILLSLSKVPFLILIATRFVTRYILLSLERQASIERVSRRRRFGR